MKNKIITLKVSADHETHRVIEIRANKSLYDLAEIIIKSFDFYFDHAFGFFSNIKNIYKSDESYELFNDLEDCEPSGNSLGVKNTIIADVFTLKKKMVFLFDYGDNWIFLVECKSFSDAVVKTRYPRVIEKIGKSPEQYPDYEEDEEV